MKKFISLFLIFSLLFAFASCGKNDGESGRAETVTTDLTQTQPLQITETTVEDGKIESDTETTEKAKSESHSQTKTSKKTETIASKVTTVITSASATIAETTKKVFTTVRSTRIPTTTKATTKTETQTQTQSAAETTTEKATSKQTAAKEKTCTVSISCAECLSNMNMLTNEAKKQFIPSDGWILKTTSLTFNDGETAFDVLKRACKNGHCSDNCAYCQKSGIQLEYSFSTSFETYYIEGIHQIYEKDFGSKSGWLFKVNGSYPNYGCSAYKLKSGDKIEFVYTVDGE